MTSDLPLYLLGVMIISLITNLIINKFYKISILKLCCFTFLSTIFGALSTMIMSYVESGSFRGTSFFGAVLLMPIIVCTMAIFLKEYKWKLLNLTAFLGMSTSALLKLRCYDYGCCGGKKIPIPTENGLLVFPSQLAEMVFAIVVFIILIILFMKNKERKDLYPIMMVIYGFGRFILNSYRLVIPVVGSLAYGHIWSIVSVIIGIIWLFVLYRKNMFGKQ